MPIVGDLHLHSYYSDGEHSISSLKKLSLNAGLSFFAITDHDTLSHYSDEEVLSELNIELIKGVEISTFNKELEYHIIGYFLDSENQTLKNLIQKLTIYRDDRMKQMINNLFNRGFNISYEEVKKKASKDFVSRNHIAEILLEKGYIRSIPEAFSPMIIGNTSKSYVKCFPVLTEVAINVIHLAGGIAILAHPGCTPGRVGSIEINELKELKDQGLDGIEVFQPKHTLADMRKYIKQAQSLDLVITGGSDFHGKYSPDIQLGMIRLPEVFLRNLKSLKE